MSSKLYTIVLDYKGGTYIAQTRAESVTGAVSQWMFAIKNEDLAEWGLSRESLVKTLTLDNAVPVASCENVWCLSGSAQEALILVHVIATAQS